MKPELTIPEAAKELGLSVSRVRTLVALKRIPTRRVGPLRVIKATDLQAFQGTRVTQAGRPRKDANDDD